MAKKKREEEEEAEAGERWLVSYADMMTLLVALFIVLFAMSSVDSNKFRALAEAINGHPQVAQAILQGGDSVLDGADLKKLETTQAANTVVFDFPSENSAQGIDQVAQDAIKEHNEQVQEAKDQAATLEGVKEEIEASLAATGQTGNVKFQITSRGLVISVITDQVLFNSGSADLRPQSSTLIHALGQPLSQVANDISVEGYTDNSPIATSKYPSNWELSNQRATSVVRRLVEKEGVAPTKIGATGYGEFRPAVPNDTAAHKAQNRRVEIVVLNSKNTDEATDNG